MSLLPFLSKEWNAVLPPRQPWINTDYLWWQDVIIIRLCFRKGHNCNLFCKGRGVKGPVPKKPRTGQIITPASTSPSSSQHSGAPSRDSPQEFMCYLHSGFNLANPWLAGSKFLGLQHHGIPDTANVQPACWHAKGSWMLPAHCPCPAQHTQAPACLWEMPGSPPGATTFWLQNAGRVWLSLSKHFTSHVSLCSFLRKRGLLSIPLGVCKEPGELTHLRCCNPFTRSPKEYFTSDSWL